ncbi:MAG: tryptophan-rich sensory protein [Epulopiscium sp.]|nr:tryptophan-rich sensory protein [Candidatus Epulonipiscium sp.]
MDNTKKAWINGFFLAVTLVINILGSFGVINGLSQKQVSDMFPTLITPSHFTFRIWSVIYSLLIVSIILMITKKRDSYYQQAVGRISMLFPLSCVFNTAWVIAFCYIQIELSSFFILGLTITLVFICKQLLHIQEGGRWLLPLSFGLYAGWLCIATVVNIFVALVKNNWQGFGLASEMWAAIVLIAVVLLVMGLQFQIYNAVFPLPIAWAYFGIYHFLKVPEGFDGQYGLLQVIALAGMIVFIGVAAIQLYKNHATLQPSLKKHKLIY